MTRKTTAILALGAAAGILLAACKKNSEMPSPPNNRINVLTLEDRYTLLYGLQILNQTYVDYTGSKISEPPGATGTYSYMNGTTGSSATQYADDRRLPA